MKTEIKTSTQTSNDLSKLTISNPEQAILGSGLRTVEDVLKIKGLPSIAKMALTSNDMKLVILKWLIHANKFMNLKRQMTEAQSVLAAITILEDYSYLNTADLALFFKNLINGKYGNFYESFNNQKLCDALDLYVESRFETAKSRSEANHNRFSSGDIQSTFLEDKKREKKKR